jgi:hypothetical protein
MEIAMRAIGITLSYVDARIALPRRENSPPRMMCQCGVRLNRKSSMTNLHWNGALTNSLFARPGAERRDHVPTGLQRSAWKRVLDRNSSCRIVGRVPAEPCPPRERNERSDEQPSREGLGSEPMILGRENYILGWGQEWGLDSSRNAHRRHHITVNHLPSNTTARDCS